MKKKFIIFLILLIAVIIAYKYVYKSHRNIQLENPNYVLKAADLIAEFNANNEGSTQKYLDNTIIISGKVTGVNSTSIEVDSSIVCYMFDTIIDNTNLSSEIRIKGRCIGFDELLEEIKFDQCIFLKN